ncbi:MAG: hypothetical protein RL318_2368 [Fibrobacterota bacterium]|jgi:TolB-like protein
MKLRALPCALALLAALACSTYAAEPRIPQIAVMPLSARSVDSGTVATIEDAIGSELLRTRKVRVLERSQMNRILKEQGFQQSACSQSDCSVEVGKLLAVDRLLVGSLGHVGSTYSLTLRMVDVGSGEVLGSSTRNQKGAIDDVLTQCLPLSVNDLLPDTSPKPVPVPEQQAKAPSSGGSVWPWVLGGVVIAGGATAAVLLMQGDATPEAAASTPNTNIVPTTSSVEMTVP